MYLSVGGVMALIVALWVMVLPVQLDKANKNGIKSVFGVSDEYQENKPSLLEEWRTSVDSAQRSMLNMSDGVEFEFDSEATLTEGEGQEAQEDAPAETGEPPVALDVDTIREKLDASAQPEGEADEETVQQ
jgi:hypothetical protein